MKPIYTTIPIQLIIYCLTKTRVNHLKLYLYLKHTSSGKVPYDNELIKLWAVDMDVSVKTMRDHLKWLIQNKWIVVNRKNNMLTIISYKKLLAKLKFSSRGALKYDTEDFQDLKEYCCGALISYLVRVKSWTGKNKRSVQNMKCAKTNRSNYPKGFTPLSISYIAAFYNISPSTANNYKKIAQNANLITVKRNLVYILDENENRLGKEHYEYYKMCVPSLSGRVRRGTKFLKVVESDLIKSNIIMGRKHQ